MSRLIVCADDFAISDGVSDAILQLLEKGRLSAVSCMTLFEDWPTQGRKLLPFRRQVDLGLHLTFSGPGAGPCLQVRSKSGYVDERGRFLELAGLGRKLWLNQVDLELLDLEIRAQIQRFQDVIGQAPDFIDGHQYAHQLPGLRELILPYLQGPDREKSQRRIYTRSSRQPRPFSKGLQSFLKCEILRWAGQSWRARLTKADVFSNDQLIGDFHFSLSSAAARRRALESLDRDAGRTIWVVHPGFVDEQLKERDSLWRFREEEFAFLNGEEMKALMDEGLVRPERFF